MKKVEFTIVLVRPMYEKNIGASARALANMGGRQLILLDPQCSVGYAAHESAAGAQKWLNSLVSYPSWKDFNKSERNGPRIGLTRRHGKGRRVVPLKSQLVELHKDYEQHQLEHIYLVFGPEDDGLTADDLLNVNFACCLETYGEFGSLNLAQAVLLSLYVGQAEVQKWESCGVPSTNASTGDFDYLPEGLLRDWISAIGFQVDARKSSALLTLRRIFNLKNPTKHEFQVIESVLRQTVRKLTEKSI